MWHFVIGMALGALLPSGGPSIVSAYCTRICEGTHSHVFQGNTVWVSGWAHDGFVALRPDQTGKFQRVGWYSDPEVIDRATHMSIDERGIGYIASERADSLTSVDLNDVSCPKTLGSWQDADLFDCPVASVTLGKYCLAIARGPWQDFPGQIERKTGDALLVFDTKDPMQIGPVGVLQDHEFLAGPRDILLDPDGCHVLVAAYFSKSLVRIDITDPIAPVLVDWVSTASIGCSPHSLDWVTKDVVAFCGNNTLGLADFSGTPRLLGSFTGHEWVNGAYSVAVTREHAVVASRNGNCVSLFDLKDLSKPEPVWKLRDDQLLAGAYYITVSKDGSFAYANGYGGNSFAVIDLKLPALDRAAEWIFY